MIDTQLGRRNLTPIQRIAIAEKYRPIIEKKAKENKIKAMEKARENNPNNVDEQFSQISDITVNKVDTKKELSKIANVSYYTYYKGKRILDSDNEEIKNKLKNKLNKHYFRYFK